MSSTDSTEIAKTDDLSLASDLDKSLSDSISKKFSNVEIAYVKPDRIRVNVKKEEIIDVASFIRDELNFDHAESVSELIIQKTNKLRWCITWAPILIHYLIKKFLP